LHSNITIEILKSSDGTFGYNILIDKKLYIYQITIPAVDGNRGFVTEMDAQKTAELMVTKIRNNTLPPSVSIEELSNLDIK
jgi:Domain of unknown function (DUF4907)